MVLSTVLARLQRTLRVKIFNVGITLLLLCCTVQVQVIAATSYKQNEGLSNLGVQALVRDDQGFIWVGSEEGLQRFDGHRFMPVSLDTPGGLADIYVRHLLAVPGALYVLTPSRLLRYDLKLHRIAAIPVADETGKLSEFSSIAISADGLIYAGTYNGRLYSWRDAKAGVDGASVTAPKPQLVSFTVEPLNTGISSITGLHVGASGLFIASSKGAYLMKPGSTVARAIRFNQPAIANGAAATFALHEYPAGVLWIGYWNDALVRLDLKTETARWFHPKQPGAGALRSTSIFSFASRTDRLYIGTNRGIVVYYPSCDCLRGLNLPAWNQLNGSGLITSALAIENDGLWAGVWGEGLTRFSLSDEVFQHQVRVDGQAASLAHPMVYALHTTKDQLWLGTYGGGVQLGSLAQLRDGETWNFQTLPWGKYPIESQFVWSIQAANESTAAANITIGTGFGFYNWRGDAANNLQSGRLQEFKTANGNKSVESIRNQFTTADGRRYVGSNDGLYRIVNDALVTVNFSDGAKDNKLSQKIWSMSENAGQLWLGTSRGLVRLNDKDQFIALHPPGVEASQMPGTQVLVQKRDGQGSLWIGTSNGLVKVLGTTDAPVFERQTSIDKLGVKRINSIEFDKAGQLWMGTPNGVLRYQPKIRRADLYDRRDGLVGEQLNFNSSANDGRLLYFGALGGLIAFDPTAVPDTKISLTPRVARLRIGQGEWQTDATSLALSNLHEPVQIELTALSYARPDRVRYAYRWRDVDEKFTELGDAQSFVLSRIPGGEHTLEIRASSLLKSATSGVGVAADLAANLTSNSQETIAPVLTVSVAKAWFETAWGRLAIVGAIIAMLVGFTRWRMWRAVRYTKELQGEVAARTMQLNAASLELAQSNALLQRQARIDPLTGLANRRYLFELAHEKMQANGMHSIIMLDLDNFKKINDTYGHASGDAVLRDFAEVLSEIVGSKGVTVRYGGEEFLVMLFNLGHQDVLEMTKRLVEAARNRKVHDARRAAEAGSGSGGSVGSGNSGIRYTVSAGVASGAVGRDNVVITNHPIERLIAQADAALYQAKTTGRDRFVEAAADKAGETLG